MENIIFFIQSHRRSLLTFALSAAVSACAVLGIKTSIAEEYKKITVTWYPVEKATLVSTRSTENYQGENYHKLAELLGLRTQSKTLWIPKSVSYDGKSSRDEDNEKYKDDNGGKSYDGVYSNINDLQEDFEKYSIIGQAYTARADGKKSKYKAKWRGNSLVPDTSTYDGKEAQSGKKAGNVTWDDIKKNPEKYPVAWMTYKMFSVKVASPFDSSKEIDFFNIGGSSKDMLEYSDVSRMSFGNGKTIAGVAEKINDQMGGIAAYLLFCFLLISLASSALSENRRLTPPQMIWKIAKFLIIMRLSFESWNLCGWIMETCDSAVVIVSHAVGASSSPAVMGSTVGQATAVMIANMSLIDKVVSFILVAVLWIMVLATATAVLVFVITRVFRILIMMAFAPIPIALLADEKTSGTAQRYIMNLFALGLECAVIVILSAFYGVMLANGMPGVSMSAFGIADMVKYLLEVIICNAVFAASIQKSVRISQGIISGESA